MRSPCAFILTQPLAHAHGSNVPPAVVSSLASIELLFSRACEDNMKRYSSIGGLALLLAVGLLFSCSSKEPGSSGVADDNSTPYVEQSSPSWGTPFSRPGNLQEAACDAHCHLEESGRELSYRESSPVLIAGHIEHVAEILEISHYVFHPDTDSESVGDCSNDVLVPALVLSLRLESGQLVFVYLDTPLLRGSFADVPRYRRGVAELESLSNWMHQGKVAIPISAYDGENRLLAHLRGTWFYELSDGTVSYSQAQDFACDFPEFRGDAMWMGSWDAFSSVFDVHETLDDLSTYSYLAPDPERLATVGASCSSSTPIPPHEAEEPESAAP